MGVARAAHFGLGMRVLGHDPFLERFPAHIRPASIEGIFKECEVISLHVPLTDETRGMVKAGLLGTVKPGALLINACRGEVIAEADLIAALKSGPLGAAALDVFPEEPLPPSHPYYDLPNVLLTPHSAALTGESVIRMGQISCGDIVRVLSGEKPLYGVNMEIWPGFAAAHGHKP
jgi:D-3-phosphoglycerate dehydrogenase